MAGTHRGVVLSKSEPAVSSHRERGTSPTVRGLNLFSTERSHGRVTSLYGILPAIGYALGAAERRRLTICADVRHSSRQANKSLRGNRGPEAGVRGLPSPFIKIYERGRETPHHSLLPLLPMRKDFLDEILVSDGPSAER